MISCSNDLAEKSAHRHEKAEDSLLDLASSVTTVPIETRPSHVGLRGRTLAPCRCQQTACRGLLGISGSATIPAHLLELAKARANSAVRAADFSAIYLGTETTIRWLDAAVHAGSAIEILAKYYLSTVSAVLLLDNTKLQDSDYLHAVGRSDLVPPEDKYRALNLRTRGPKECLDLIGLMTNKKDQISGGSARAALDARNAAIHLGLIDRAELQAALIIESLR